jgi:hypothetical protein
MLVAHLGHQQIYYGSFKKQQQFDFFLLKLFYLFEIKTKESTEELSVNKNKP